MNNDDISKETKRILSKDYEEDDRIAVMDKEDYVHNLCSCGPLAEVKDKIYSLYAILKNLRKYKQWYILAMGVLVYIISPIDLVPDTIPLLGLLDDVAILNEAFTQTGYIHCWRKIS